MAATQDGSQPWEGARNLAGLKNPVVDALIENLIAAPDRTSLVARTRALDAVLQWQHLVIPNWHIPYDRIVYWNRFGRPKVTPDEGNQFFAWWIDAQKDAKLTNLRRTKK